MWVMVGEAGKGKVYEKEKLEWNVQINLLNYIATKKLSKFPRMVLCRRTWSGIYQVALSEAFTYQKAFLDQFSPSGWLSALLYSQRFFGYIYPSIYYTVFVASKYGPMATTYIYLFTIMALFFPSQNFVEREVDIYIVPSHGPFTL